jgi:hypothetical protein
MGARPLPLGKLPQALRSNPRSAGGKRAGVPNMM